LFRFTIYNSKLSAELRINSLLLILKMSSENIILSIDGHNYDQWKTQICRRAATYGSNAYKHGLLRLIITEEEWEIKFTGTPAPM
jgi:hypothetical protein